MVTQPCRPRSAPRTALQRPQAVLATFLLLTAQAAPLAAGFPLRFSIAGLFSSSNTSTGASLTQAPPQPATTDEPAVLVSQAGAEASQPASCPFPYPQHSLEALRNGTLPYLFGGPRKPCNSCRMGDIPEFCQFLRPEPDEFRVFQHTAHLCSREQQAGIVRYLLQRGFWEPLQFTPCHLWPHLRGRTLWILGDSQALDLHVAAECFMREFWDLVQRPLQITPDMVLKFAGAGVKGIQDLPHCEHLPEGTRICFVRANEAKVVVDLALPWLLDSQAQAEDIILVSFGLWHHDQTVYWQQLERLGKLYAAYKGAFPHMLWRETPPQHFLTPGGMFIKGIGLGKPPFICGPIANVTLQDDHSLRAEVPEQEDVVRGGWRNVAARQVLGRYHMPMVPVWNDTVPLFEYHRSNMGRAWECGHYCHPSAPQLWLYSLDQVLKQLVIPLPQQSPQAEQHTAQDPPPLEAEHAHQAPLTAQETPPPKPEQHDSRARRIQPPLHLKVLVQGR